MDVKCSFSSLVGGSCSYDPRDRSRSTEVIPFLNCKRDIAGHKSSLSITDVETEIELWEEYLFNSCHEIKILVDIS